MAAARKRRLSVKRMSCTRIVDYHTSPDAAWDAMLRACANAKRCIELEEYILDPDEIGTRFVELLCKRAREGVQVKLLLDWWGCKTLAFSPLHKQLKKAGVDVQYYRPPRLHWLWKRGGFFPRDHRKILIIDKHHAFIGGICLYDRVQYWRDTMVEVNGRITSQIRHIFWQTWHNASGEVVHKKSAPLHFDEEEEFSICANAPDTHDNSFSQWLIDEIRNAEREVCLTTPYFTPHAELLEALQEAIARGVRVEIICSNYSKYAPLVVGKRISKELHEMGAHIYYYQPSMLHLKQVLIDGKKGAIGSCNLDGLSIYHNQEIMLLTRNEQMLSELRKHYQNDLQDSVRYTRKSWQNVSWKDKLSGYMLRPVSYYL